MNIRLSFSALSLPIIGIVCSSQALAQQGFGEDGRTGFSPALEAGATNHSNFYLRPQDAESANGISVRPSLTYNTQGPRMTAKAVAAGDATSYDLPGSEDDYADANFSGAVDYQAGIRWGVGLDAAATLSHDPFGLERTSGAPIDDREVDRWGLYSAGARLLTGAPDARVNVELRGGGQRKEYRNNRADTVFLDHDIVRAGFTVFYNVSPKTALLFDLNRSEVDFERDAPRDATETSARVGARWKITGKSTGDVRVGGFRRESDTTDDVIDSGADWAVSLGWAATERSQVSVTAERSSQESYVTQNRLINVRSFRVGFSQQFTARYNAALSAGVSNSDFVDTGREDDGITASLDQSLQINKPLSAKLTVAYTERDSTLDLADYEGVTAFLGLRYAP